MQNMYASDFNDEHAFCHNFSTDSIISLDKRIVYCDCDDNDIQSFVQLLITFPGPCLVDVSVNSVVWTVHHESSKIALKSVAWCCECYVVRFLRWGCARWLWHGNDCCDDFNWWSGSTLWSGIALDSIR